MRDRHICSRKGICRYDTGLQQSRCFCSEGWQGHDCSTPVPPIDHDPASEASDGACQRACRRRDRCAHTHHPPTTRTVVTTEPSMVTRGDAAFGKVVVSGRHRRQAGREGGSTTSQHHLTGRSSRALLSRCPHCLLTPPFRWCTCVACAAVCGVAGLRLRRGGLHRTRHDDVVEEGPCSLARRCSLRHRRGLHAAGGRCSPIWIPVPGRTRRSALSAWTQMPTPHLPVQPRRRRRESLTCIEPRTGTGTGNRRQSMEQKGRVGLRDVQRWVASVSAGNKGSGE